MAITAKSKVSPRKKMAVGVKSRFGKNSKPPMASGKKR